MFLLCADNATGFYPVSHDCFTSFELIISVSLHVHMKCVRAGRFK